MKNKRWVIPSTVLLIVSVTIACSLFSFRVSALVFKPDTLPAVQVGEPYEAKIYITENTTPVGGFSISQGDLPVGLELVKNDGEDTATISGIAEESGTFTFVVSVWCYGTNTSGQTGDKEYSIVVEK